MENFDDTFLARWMAQETSVEENEAFKTHPDYAAYLKIKQASDALSFSDFDEEKSFAVLTTKLSTAPKTKVVPLYAWIAGLAASVLLLFGLFFYNNSDNTYQTQIANVENIALPDNSTMILNATAKATVNTKDWEKERDLFLEGEAFFKVQKGKTFTVNTKLGKVQVLGTQFTVNTIDENLFIVKCFEGKVKVMFHEQEHILTAGKAIQWLNGAPNLWNFAEKEPSWLTNNETKLHNMPLNQVISVFKRQYPIEFSNLKVVNLDTRFTGTFTNKNVEEALYAVFGTLGVNYELLNKNEVRLLNK